MMDKLSIPVQSSIVAFLSVADHLCHVALASKMLLEAARARLSWPRKLDLSRVRGLKSGFPHGYAPKYGLQPHKSNITHITLSVLEDVPRAEIAPGLDLALGLGETVLGVTLQARSTLVHSRTSRLQRAMVFLPSWIFISASINWSCCTSLELRGIRVGLYEEAVSLMANLEKWSSIRYFKTMTTANQSMLAHLGDAIRDPRSNLCRLERLGLRMFKLVDDDAIRRRLSHVAGISLTVPTIEALLSDCPTLHSVSGYLVGGDVATTALVSSGLPVLHLEISWKLVEISAALSDVLVSLTSLKSLTIEDYHGSLDSLYTALSRPRKTRLEAVTVKWNQVPMWPGDIERLSNRLITHHIMRQCRVHTRNGSRAISRGDFAGFKAFEVLKKDVVSVRFA
jgi:hypothetical protein